MNPPTMAGWNLALRFALEVAALGGLATLAWRHTAGPVRWVAVVAVPLVAAAIWGIFNVPDDPSRSGGAPIPVPGAVRLALELVILAGGTTALALSGRRELGIALGVLILVHYSTSIPRIQWLLNS